MYSKEDTRYFSYVFSKLNLNPRIKQHFQNCKVQNIVFSQYAKEMIIHLEDFEVQSASILQTLETEIKNNLTGINKVSVQFIHKTSHTLSSEKKQQQLENNWPQILQQLGAKACFLEAILRYAKWEFKEDLLIIQLPASYKVYLQSLPASHMLKDILEQYIGRIAVKFDFKDEIKYVMPKMNEEIHKITQDSIKHITTQHPKNDLPVQEQINGEVSDLLLGKEFSGQTVLLSQLPENDEVVIIKAAILSIDIRELKNDNILVALDVTDYTYSMTVKFFVKKDKWEPLKGTIKKGSCLKIRGLLEYDSFIQERIIKAKDILKIETIKLIRMDKQEEKRVELHAHTQMSSMDATVHVSELVGRAARWGHSAIAITDHGIVQSFPDAASAAKKHNIKVIYGVEAYLVDDLGAVVQNDKGQTLEDTYVVFDIETTGFTPGKDGITEIGAVKIKAGKVIETYQTFVNPERPIPSAVVELTGITDEMVKDAPTMSHVIPEFLNFVGQAVVVAHNAAFDTSFINYFANQLGVGVSHTVVDTLGLSRLLLTELTRHKLNQVAKHLEINLENHHRAIDDARATAEIFIKLTERLKNLNIKTLEEINLYAAKEIDTKKLKTYHAIILVQNQKGLFNLYNLITKSHIEYFFKKPRIPKSIYKKYSEGLLIGSACEAGEVYKALLDNKSQEQIDSIASFYDYLEIQPLANNYFLLEKGKIQSYEELKEINRKIVELGKKHHKKVVATGDIHFLDPEDEVYRRIIMTGQGYADADRQPPLYFHTTDEFLKEFEYLGKDTAYEVVVKNTQMLAESIEHVKPIPDETFPPKIDGADEELVEITTNKAVELYGEVLPKPVKDRLDRELNSIIKNGFAVLYIIAQKLVWKSLEDGYLVGSRGSVGSSFVATMAGITEVNPLSPHYVCPNCKYSDFDSPEVVRYAGGSGCDMPDKACPVCGTSLTKEGHDIPFETFLGFDGDKEPDIDLNFSGEYQPRAHAYTEELFGSSHVFRAGTIGTLAEKTAYGFVQKYLDEKHMKVSKAEVGRLISGCTGIKRTTGQHPGGLMVVPRDNDIHNFCPVQRPANDMKSTTTTTHFDYHSISGRLLKLDILGHDDPTIIRMLEDLTGINATQIPLDDKKTMSLFTTTEALQVTKEDIRSEVGSLGIPEFGTKFVRQMLVDTKPGTFSELIRISGLSHGTDVWLNNAQELVRQGVATLSEVISTRDDIMVYLIIEGVEKKAAFKIMECVRKGKGLTQEQEAEMTQAGVKRWYIDSCKKIKYMFPKAHAAAYVMMAFRIAYFKVYYPKAFYAAYFSIRAKGNFDYEMMCHGKEAAEQIIRELEQRPNLSTKEKDMLTVLELVREMYARGIHFKPIDLYESDSEKFIIHEDGILPPFNSLQGLGDTAAKNIVEKRKQGEFLSVEQFRSETKVSQTIIELMKKNGILKGIPDTSQLTLF